MSYVGPTREGRLVGRCALVTGASSGIGAAVGLDRMALTYVTPVGGTTLMVGWGVLAWAAFAGMHGRDGLQ